MQAQEQKPIVVTIVPATPAPERNIGDVILSALGVLVVLVLVSVALGVLVAGLRVAWHRLRPPDDDHMPPVSPSAGR